jgi:hypothetical protein
LHRLAGDVAIFKDLSAQPLRAGNLERTRRPRRRFRWTIARPPRLINTSDERYRATRDALPSGAFSMSFRAVAAFMLDTVEHRTHVHQVVGLAS